MFPLFYFTSDSALFLPDYTIDILFLMYNINVICNVRGMYATIKKKGEGMFKKHIKKLMATVMILSSSAFFTGCTPEQQVVQLQEQ